MAGAYRNGEVWLDRGVRLDWGVLVTEAGTVDRA
jgi:hypothetical protein